MNNPLVVKRYAKAILSIGIERDILDTLREQLTAIGALYERSHEFRSVMLNPSVKLDERKAVVRAMAEKYGFDDMTRNFCLLLLDNDRFRFIKGIADEVDHLTDAHHGIVRAQVTSATALEDAEIADIRAALAELTGKKVEVNLAIDPALIGGVVARIGGMVLDGSVRTQLGNLRQSILQEI